MHVICCRILLLIPMIFAASVIIFLMLRLGTGPALDYLRLSNLPPTPEMVASTRAMLGLDQPLVVQYGSWLWRALHLDFGVSFATQRPVLDDVLLPARHAAAGGRGAGADPAHLRAAGHLGGASPRSPAGFHRAAHRLSRRVDAQLLAGLSAGDVLLGLSAVAAGDGLRRLAASSCRPCRLPLCRWRSTPACCAPACWKSPDSVTSPGRACAACARQTERRHILRNASLPMITAVGMHIGELIGGTMIIENIFAWPGVGRYAVSAIFNRDYPVIQCFTLMMVMVFALCNLAVDLLNAALDPRIRRHEGAHS
jgi:nickel transport system permease protein